MLLVGLYPSEALPVAQCEFSLLRRQIRAQILLYQPPNFATDSSKLVQPPADKLIAHVWI